MKNVENRIESRVSVSNPENYCVQSGSLQILFMLKVFKNLLFEGNDILNSPIMLMWEARWSKEASRRETLPWPRSVSWLQWHQISDHLLTTFSPVLSCPAVSQWSVDCLVLTDLLCSAEPESECTRDPPSAPGNRLWCWEEGFVTSLSQGRLWKMTTWWGKWKY